MIYLNKEDVLKCIDFDELMDSIEEAYKIYESKKFNMPDRIHIDNNDLTALYMPCFLAELLRFAWIHYNTKHNLKQGGGWLNTAYTL